MNSSKKIIKVIIFTIISTYGASASAEIFQCYFSPETRSQVDAKSNSATCTGSPELTFSSKGHIPKRNEHCKTSSTTEKLINFNVDSIKKTVTWTNVFGSKDIEQEHMATILAYTKGSESVNNHMGKHYKQGKIFTNRIITFSSSFDLKKYNLGESFINYTLYIPGANENAILATWNVMDHEQSWVNLMFGKCKKTH